MKAYTKEYYIEKIENYVNNNPNDDDFMIPLNEITVKLVRFELNCLGPFDGQTKSDIYDRIDNIIKARACVLHNTFPSIF